MLYHLLTCYNRPIAGCIFKISSSQAVLGLANSVPAHTLYMYCPATVVSVLFPLVSDRKEALQLVLIIEKCSGWLAKQTFRTSGLLQYHMIFRDSIIIMIYVCKFLLPSLFVCDFFR